MQRCADPHGGRLTLAAATKTAGITATMGIVSTSHPTCPPSLVMASYWRHFFRAVKLKMRVRPPESVNTLLKPGVIRPLGGRTGPPRRLQRFLADVSDGARPRRRSVWEAELRSSGQVDLVLTIAPALYSRGFATSQRRVLLAGERWVEHATKSLVDDKLQRIR